MKKVLSTLLVVVFLMTSLGITSLAEESYTTQYLGDGFTRLTLSDSAFVAGTTRNFTVNIPEDGDYAVYLSNPDLVKSAIDAYFIKGDESKRFSSNIATEAYNYARIGVGNGSSLNSVALTEGEWTLRITTGTNITVPFIDIRPTTIKVDGSKQAIYPLDANTMNTVQTYHKTVSELAGTNYASAPADYTYFGDLNNENLAVKRTNPNAIIVRNNKYATYKLNVQYPGTYKIIGYGKLRTTDTVATEDSASVEMIVGSNPAVIGSYTFPANTRVNGWSSFISIESTVTLPAGETTITFNNHETDGVKGYWYLNYIGIEGLDVEYPEEPEEPDVVVDETPKLLVSDTVADYYEAALASYNTPAYADYTTTLVSASRGNDYSRPVALNWSEIDGAESYDLYLSTSENYDENLRVIRGIEDTTYDVINLLAGSTYYWKAVSGETVSTIGTFRTVSAPRFITVEGVNNVRDIGGWNGLNQGMAYRGTELNLVGTNGFELTEEGKRVMHDDLGIKTDLDLRSTAITESPIGSDVNFIRVVISNYVAAFSETTKYKTVLETFADIDNYPIYFHCMGGADRTGTVAVIVEALAGADEGELSIDFELTSFSKVGARTRNSTSYKYKELIAGLRAYEGATLQEKTENYAIKTLGLTRKQVSNIQSLMGGNKVVFADTAPVDVKEDTTIELENLGDNTVASVWFEGSEIPFEMNGNVITIDLETLGLGEIRFSDGSVLKFEANSDLPITFATIAGNQATDFVTKNLNLPAGYVWTSSNPAVVSTTGVVTRPEFKDVVVELTASSEKGIKSFMFTVKAKTISSYNQSYFADPALTGTETDTAVLGTVGGNDSLVYNWYVANADVTSSTVTADDVLRVNFTSKSNVATQVHVDLDETAAENFVIEFDMLNDWSNATNKYIDLFAKAKKPDGTIQNVRILQFDGASNRLRGGVGSAHFKTLGGTDIPYISGNKINVKIEFNPVKMTARYAGMNSGNNWNNYTTIYPDLLNNRYQIDGADITDINTLPDVNYEIIGFYFQPRAVSATTADIDSFKVYTQRECAVADMSVAVAGSSVDVDAELTSAYTGAVIIGLYDADDRLVGAKIANLTSQAQIDETVSFIGTPVRANVFFLENMTTIVPLKTNVPLQNTALEWN